MFSDLFAYRQREARAPLEDFATEALKATLNALPPIQSADFIGWLYEGTLNEFVTKAICNGEVEWESQYCADRRRIDLVMFVGTHPVLAFENKVSAPLGMTSSSDDTMANQSQLEVYGKWLHKQPCNDSLRILRSLIFLTHTTASPTNFSSGDKNGDKRYAILNRRVFRWRDVSQRLAEITDALDEQSHAKCLAYHFSSFLEDHGMSERYPDNQDLAALHAFVSHSDRISFLIKELWSRSRSSLAKYSSKDAFLTYEAPGGCVWKYSSSGKFGPRGYIAVGIRYPDISEWWSEDQSPAGGPVVFIALGDHREELVMTAKDLSTEHWQTINSDIIAERFISAFSSDADKRGKEIGDWVEARAEELAIACDAYLSGKQE